MPRIVIDFWVLTANGIVLYSKVSDQKVNPQLFGALMSALNKIAEKLTDGGISNFEMSDLRFVVIKRVLANWDNNVETFSDFGDYINQFLEK
jgi:hypothetical protein